MAKNYNINKGGEMRYIVRKIKKEDLEPGKGFFATLSNLTKTPSLSFEERLAIWEKIKNRGDEVFVAVSQEKGEIIGTVKFLLDWKFFRGGSLALHLEDFVVREGYEGQGVAMALWEFFLERAKELKPYKIILDCDKDLVPFYRDKLGFYEFEICMRKDNL